MASTLLNIQDMHTLIEQDVQKLGFYVYDDLETEEIDLQINRQTNKLIEGILDKYFGRSPKVGPEEGFQLDQVTLDNLRKQHVKDQVATLTTFDDGSKFDLPDNYSHYIKAKAIVSYSCRENKVTTTKTKTVKLRIGETLNIDAMREHPFFKTSKDSPLCEIANNSIYIYTDPKFTITDVKFDYIKKPIVVKYAKDVDGNYDPVNSVNSDLDDSLHYMLVDMTSIRIMKIIETQQQKIENIQQDTI